MQLDAHALGSSSLGKSQKEVSKIFSQTIPELAMSMPAIVLLDEVETLAADRQRMSLEANPIDAHRAGVDPNSPGASPHGLRHYYKWYARHELGLDEDIVQLMLRHISLVSQRHYGKNATDIYDAMNKVNARTADHI